MTSNTTIGIDNYFTASQTCISHRTTSDKAASGIDKNLCRTIKQIFRNNGLNDMINHVLADLFTIDIISMLCGNDNRIYAYRNSLLVLNGHLTLTIWAQIGHRPIATP